MKKYIRIYVKLLHLSWMSLMIYRANFFNSIISSVIWSFFNVTVIFLLTSRTPVVFGWTRSDLILLVAGANMMLGTFYFLFSINIREFSNVVNKGKLDSILLKPIDSQFSVSLWQSSYQSLARAIFGIIVASFVIFSTHITIPFVVLTIFPIFLFLGIVIQYSIWFAVTTVTIWFTTLSNLNDLLYNTNDLSRFPPEMFRAGKEFIYFLVFPFTLIVVVPVKLLLAKATNLDILLLSIFSLTFLFLSRKFFHFALRFYTSAGG